MEGLFIHSFLRSIGFSSIRRKTDLEKVLGTVMTTPGKQVYVQSPLDPTRQLCEKSMDFSENIGISVIGEYDSNNFFHVTHYFPYLRGNRITVRTDVAVNHRVDSDAYTGMCSDYRFGTSLIFYLQNSLDYLRNAEGGDHSTITGCPITLTALASSGKILLPIKKTPALLKIALAERSKYEILAKAAHIGSEDAITDLTMRELDTYAMINRRIKTEDVYSIVESTFIPYGSESDNYTILGTIMDVQHKVNSITNEAVTELYITCNGLSLLICINDADLLGEARPGRRFKGNIWLQGYLDFEKIY